MKRLLSFLVFSTLLCPAYAMDRSKEDFLTNLETKVEKYVNTDAACAQILRYYLLGRINVTQFKDLLKKKELFSDLAKLLRIEEATLHTHFDKIAPHLSEITDEKVLNQIIKTLLEGKQPDTKMLTFVIDQKKAIPLMAGLLGVEIDGLNAFIQRLTDDPLIAAKKAILDEINVIDTIALTAEIARLEAELANNLIELNNCQGRIDTKNVALQTAIQQNGSTLPRFFSTAATGMFAYNMICSSCEYYINSNYAMLTALALACTAIMHHNNSQDHSSAVTGASKNVQDEIAARTTINNQIVTLRAQIQSAQRLLTEEEQRKVGLEKQLTQIGEAETARGSVLDQGWGLAQEALKNQAIKFLAQRAGVNLADMQADEASTELQAFLNTITEEQKKLLNEPKTLEFMALSSEVAIYEINFLNSLNNDQCTQLVALLEKDQAEKTAGFNLFSAAIPAKIHLLQVPARLLLAEYQPVILFLDEDNFINRLSEDEAILFFGLLPKELQNTLSKTKK